MMFLLRAAFWLSIVVLLLPTGGAPSKSAAEIDAGDAVSAATAAVSDMRHFCSRQPEACAVGGQMAVAFGHKAQAAAKMVYDVLTDSLGPSETGSVPASAAANMGGTILRSQNTLAPTDLAPEWRAPAQRKEARTNRPA